MRIEQQPRSGTKEKFTMQDIKTRTGNNYLQRFLLALLAIAALA